MDMIFLKKGWIEHRRSERDKTTILVDYRIIPPAMVSQLQHDANYSRTHIKGDLITTCAHLFGLKPEVFVENGILLCTRTPCRTDGGSS
jgi:hypothetical protein